MGLDEEVEVKSEVVKTPLQSRKFIAFLVAESTWKIIISIVVIMGMKDGDIDLMLGSIVLFATTIVGFVEAGYIIGQASLDKYLGLARIAADAGQGIVIPKGAELRKTESKAEAPVQSPERGDQ